MRHYWNIADPVDAFLAYDEDNRPELCRCAECGEPIMDKDEENHGDDYYNFDGDKVHFDCGTDYINHTFLIRG